jgi:hypothetical protein
MKSKLYFILFVFASTMVLSSCKKAETNYCAACIEANSGYRPTDYCGHESEVDLYISTLKAEGAKLGQSWSCSKN